MGGSIPTELGSLANLQKLELCLQQVYADAIPTEFGSLSNLQRLDLSINGLSGSIPAELGSLTSLTYLNLISNESDAARSRPSWPTSPT